MLGLTTDYKFVTDEMNGWMDKWMDVWMYGWMDEGTYEHRQWMDG